MRRRVHATALEFLGRFAALALRALRAESRLERQQHSLPTQTAQGVHLQGPRRTNGAEFGSGALCRKARHRCSSACLAGRDGSSSRQAIRRCGGVAAPPAGPCGLPAAGSVALPPAAAKSALALTLSAPPRRPSTVSRRSGCRRASRPTAPRRRKHSPRDTRLLVVCSRAKPSAMNSCGSIF